MLTNYTKNSILKELTSFLWKKNPLYNAECCILTFMAIILFAQTLEKLSILTADASIDLVV